MADVSEKTPMEITIKPSVEAQCLVQDGEDHWFLCPRDRKDEAERYFQSAYEGLKEPGFIPAPLPAFLKAINGPDQIYFFSPAEE